jgi:hypothetical protein
MPGLLWHHNEAHAENDRDFSPNTTEGHAWANSFCS